MMTGTDSATALVPLAGHWELKSVVFPDSNTL